MAASRLIGVMLWSLGCVMYSKLIRDKVKLWKSHGPSGEVRI